MNARVLAMLVVLVSISVLTACGEVKARFADAGDGADATPPGPDAQTCSAQVPCADGVCADGICVGCIDAAQCGGETPVCDPAARECRGCSAHAECGSLLCDTDTGVCLPPERAVFVGPEGADGGGCGTQAAPCRSFAAAMAKLTAPRNRLRLLPGTYSAALPLPALVTGVIVIAEGATLDGASLPATAEHVVDMATGGDVVLDGAIVQNAPRAGIRCDRGTLTLRRVIVRNSATYGIRATACVVRIAQSLFSFNTSFAVQSFAADQSNPIDAKVYVDRTRFDGNQGGGIEFSGLIDVRNSVFVRTGFEYNSAIRGSQSIAGTVVAFNTFVSNVAGFVSVVQCGGEGVVSSNVFHRNRTEIGGVMELTSTCKTVESNYADKVMEASSNRPNVVGDTPGFVSFGTDDFHLIATSPLIDAGDPAYATAVDHDGKPRPVGGAPDIGAFERP